MFQVRVLSSVCLALVGLLRVIPTAVAQLSAPNCTDASYEWTFNSLNQGPCTMAVYLEAVCSSGSFSLPPLTPGSFYTGPSQAQAGDICMCNSVVYSLISACDACQGAVWLSYSEYNHNCTAIASEGTLPSGLTIPSGTRVPHWAYLNVSGLDSWDNTSAFAAIGGAESSATGGATTINPSTTGQSTFPASLTDASSTSTGSGSPANTGSSSSSGSSSHAGAIAGGVVGGVVGVAAIAGLIAFFLIRRRNSRVPPSAMYTGAGNGSGGGGGGGFGIDSTASPGFGSAAGQWDQSLPGMSETPRKYYNPSDPSTFPTTPSPSSPTIHTTTNTYNKDLQPNRSQYAGLPEV
ncbi:uncharacterized protein STEHIDRAFT_119338 [Stereum hirsutum FP-91666 SS1]|uniref:uncharacterized protein n=1 Tax=Stereum hirsutum (strain FP-91666) TaxID=721885 RepID=UPI000440CB90|nr:uncharacterized protein STEHIDRAFT_119338 [Stereum hirsutum FP-91666 SS1]EIM90318.1 hypothetical protein STEHIDRAFT_119338 [Stereum hirsutum FP-91666 SS1]